MIKRMITFQVRNIRINCCIMMGHNNTDMTKKKVQSSSYFTTVIKVEGEKELFYEVVSRQTTWNTTTKDRKTCSIVRVQT